MQDFTLKTFLDKNLLRPIKMIFLEPMVALITLYNSFVCERAQNTCLLDDNRSMR
jgi:hypothetical protein